MRKKLVLVAAMAAITGLLGLPAAALQLPILKTPVVETPKEPVSAVLSGLKRTGACATLYEIRIDGAFTGCTHGPDDASHFAEAAPSYPKTYAAGTPVPAVPCVGNGSSDQRVEVVYAVPILPTANTAATNTVFSTTSAAISTVTPSLSDVTHRLPNDKYDERLNALRTIFANMDDRVAASAAQTDGSRHIRFVTDANCEVVINRVNLTPVGDDTFAKTITELRQLGFDKPGRKYLVFVEANILCGIGTVDPDSTPGLTNKNNGASAQYARVDAQNSGCFDGGRVATHELFHTFGAVNSKAPHATFRGHCFDGSELMCYDDDGGSNSTVEIPDGTQHAFEFPCPVENKDRLDCNNDDYFHTAPPANNYLATHWNTADSSFLTSTLAEPPRFVAAEAATGQLTFTWSPPVTDHGVFITGYEATLFQAGVKVATKTVNPRSVTFTGLTTGTEYQVQVRALNATGKSLPGYGTGKPGALTATIAAPAYVGDPFVATFNGPVTGVSAANFTVTPNNATPAEVGTSVRCTDTALTEVSCASNNVRRGGTHRAIHAYRRELHRPAESTKCDGGKGSHQRCSAGPSYYGAAACFTRSRGRSDHVHMGHIHRRRREPRRLLR